MFIVIPFEGRVRTLIRSSFVVAKRLSETTYNLSGDAFQMTQVTAEQALVFPDEVSLEEGTVLTDELLMQALPLENFISVSADEALPNVLGLLLRTAVADGRISDEELLSVQPALKGRNWHANIAVQVGDVFTYKGSLWRCIQAHTTQGGWQPDKTPALWHRVEVVAEGTVRVWATGIDYVAGGRGRIPGCGRRAVCLPAGTHFTGGLGATWCTGIVVTGKRKQTGKSTGGRNGRIALSLALGKKPKSERRKIMPEWIARYWVEWLFGIVAALAAASYRRISKHMRHTQKKDRALDDGMRALLRDRIISACDHYFETGYAPVYARENHHQHVRCLSQSWVGMESLRTWSDRPWNYPYKNG